MQTLKAALGRFVRANRRAARRIERALGHPSGFEHSPMLRRYIDIVADRANAMPSPVIVDLGAGRQCLFASSLDADHATIIGIDISADAMARNDALDQRLVARAEDKLPLGDESVDMVVSMSALEHIPRLEPTFREIHRVLKPGGWTIHVFPSRNAPFSLLNRLLPHGLTRRLLRALIPGSDGIQGFRAYYDLCTPGEMERLIERTGFTVEETEWTSYQSDYYAFFLPFYLVSLAYDRLVQALRLRPLAATVVIAARKPSATPPDGTR